MGVCNTSFPDGIYSSDFVKFAWKCEAIYGQVDRSDTVGGGNGGIPLPTDVVTGTSVNTDYFTIAPFTTIGIDAGLNNVESELSAGNRRFQGTRRVSVNPTIELASEFGYDYFNDWLCAGIYSNADFALANPAAVDYTGTDVSFTNVVAAGVRIQTIVSPGILAADFPDGSFVHVIGSNDNDSVYRVATAANGSLIIEDGTLVAEAAGASITLRPVLFITDGNKKASFSGEIEITGDSLSFDDLANSGTGGHAHSNNVAPDIVYHQALGLVINTINFQLTVDEIPTITFGMIGRELTTTDNLIVGEFDLNADGEVPNIAANDRTIGSGNRALPQLIGKAVPDLNFTYVNNAQVQGFDYQQNPGLAAGNDVFAPVGGAEIAVNGKTLTVITDLSLEINNNAEGRRVISKDLTINSVRTGEFNATGTATALMDNEIWRNYQRYLNDQVVSITIKWTDAADNWYVIEMPRCKFNDVPADIPEKDNDIEMTLNFTSEEDQTQPTPFQLRIHKSPA